MWKIDNYGEEAGHQEIRWLAESRAWRGVRSLRTFPQEMRTRAEWGLPRTQADESPSFAREAAGLQELHHHVTTNCAMGNRNGEINSEKCFTARNRGLSTSDDSKSTFRCWFPRFSDLKIQISQLFIKKKKRHCLIPHTVFNTVIQNSSF